MAGWKHHAPTTVAQHFKRKACVVEGKETPFNLWAALIVAFFYNTKYQYADQSKFNDDRKSWINNRSNKLLLSSIGLAYHLKIAYNVVVTREVLLEIQKHYPNTQIIVIARELQGPYFYGTTESTFYDGIVLEKVIREDESVFFNVITSLKAYVHTCKPFCIHCFKEINPAKHSCVYMCDLCKAPYKCRPTEAYAKACEKCNKYFENLVCFERHKTTCSVIQRCDNCEMRYTANKHHVCFIYECNLCDIQFKTSPHYHTLRPLKFEKLVEEDKKLQVYVGFDIESMLVPVNLITKLHKPNLLIAMQKCSDCDANLACRIACPAEPLIFRGHTCVKDFNDYIFNNLSQIVGTLKGTVSVFAHNFRGYDGRFILSDIYARKLRNVTIIMMGMKILKVQVANCRFIDSLSFFQLPLRRLADAFGLSHLVKKGFFCYKLNTPENQGRILPKPSEEDFEADKLLDKDYKEFKSWYDTLGDEYNLNLEMEKYCAIDTQLLMYAVLGFRRLFKEITGLDPLTRNFTLASVGLEVFRAKFVKKGQLGINPPEGYYRRNQSAIGTAWLDVYEDEHGLEIDREVKVGRYYADGAVLPKKLVFEFDGCFYKKCKCRNDARTRAVAAKRFQVEAKQKYYAKNGFTLITMTECQVSEKVKERAKYYHFLNKLGRINIRDAFHGGRTNNIRFHHLCKSVDEIKYVDFVSMYPYVLVSKNYPVGHPKLITKNFSSNFDDYFGFVKAKILPPDDLHIPVLPSKYGDSLLFVLCQKCGEEKAKHYCPHNDDERGLVGTWTTVEIAQALQFGYKIQTIYELLHYEHVSKSLFPEYMLMWLKIKVESSGYPRENMSEAEKDAYIEQVWREMKIRLDKDKIIKDASRRSIAKLMLNSLWGKLAMRLNLPKTVLVDSLEGYWKIRCDPTLEVTSEFMVSEDIVNMTYKYKEDSDDTQGKQCLAISCFVTAYGRTELYTLLNDIETQSPGSLCYFDTDSAMFIQGENGVPNIKTGTLLGEVTDEFEGSKCDRGVWTGPKSYALEVKNPRTQKTNHILKSKGLTMDGKGKKLLNIDVLLKLSENYTERNGEGEDQFINVPQMRWISDKRTLVTHTTEIMKKFRVYSGKRWIVGNNTRPFGIRAPKDGADV